MTNKRIAEQPILTIDDSLEEMGVDLDSLLGDIEEYVEERPEAIMVVETEDENLEESREQDWENDRVHAMFLKHVRDRLQNIPSHSGKTTVGCERAIAALRSLNKEISSAMASDVGCEIDEHEAEDLRDTIMDYIDKLEKAHAKLEGKKRKKDATITLGKTVFVRLAEDGYPMYYMSVTDDSGRMLLPVEVEEPTDAQVQSFAKWKPGMQKEAASAKVFLFADPFQNEITKIIIESHVTWGKNVDDVYTNLSKKYSFTDRDHLAIQGLLREKGFALVKDTSRLGEEIGIGEGGANSSKIYPA